MPIVHIGHSIFYSWAIEHEIENNLALSGIGISTELSQYSYLEPSRRLPTGIRIKIPDYLVNSLTTVFTYINSSWKQISTFKQFGNILEFQTPTSDKLLGFSYGSFSDIYYKNGSYVYEFYMSRLDHRVYKNISIVASSHLVQENITIYFSLSKIGPWYTSLSSYSIIPTFYVKVVVDNFQHIENELLIPTEIISISCLVCE